MPPVIAPRRSVRPLVAATVATAALAGSVGYLVAVWPAPEPFVVPRDRPAPAPVFAMPTRYGGVGDYAPLCLEFLDEWVRHPGWQVTVERGNSGCLGDTLEDQVSLDASGDAVWTANGQAPRVLHLTPLELQRLHAAANLSCVRFPLLEERLGSDWTEVRWGTHASPGVRAYESVASMHLDGFVDQILDRYVGRRLDERRDFRGTVTLPPHTALLAMKRSVTVTVDGAGGVAVRSGRRHLVLPGLTGRDLVDAIDWIELGAADPLRIPQGLRYALDRATFDAGWQSDY